MATFIESLATAFLLILIVMILLHSINGTTGAWIKSKVIAG